MNPVAERLTGWSRTHAIGQPIAQIFRIFDETMGMPMPVPVDRVLATGQIHALANHTVLTTRSGTELSISNSAAPIRDAANRTIGVVLVFRDETEARARRKLIERQGTTLGALRRALPEIPIIVASGRVEDPLRAELKNLGVNVTLDKPFTQSMLSQALQSALRDSIHP